MCHSRGVKEAKTIKNDSLLKQAIQQLEDINCEEVESVSVETYKHEDGTSSFVVNVILKGGE